MEQEHNGGRPFVRSFVAKTTKTIQDSQAARQTGPKAAAERERERGRAQEERVVFPLYRRPAAMAEEGGRGREGRRAFADDIQGLATERPRRDFVGQPSPGFKLHDSWVRAAFALRRKQRWLLRMPRRIWK